MLCSAQFLKEKIIAVPGNLVRLRRAILIFTLNDLCSLENHQHEVCSGLHISKVLMIVCDLWGCSIMWQDISQQTQWPLASPLTPGDASPGAAASRPSGAHHTRSRHFLRHLGVIKLKDSEAVTVLAKCHPATGKVSLSRHAACSFSDCRAAADVILVTCSGWHRTQAATSQHFNSHLVEETGALNIIFKTWQNWPFSGFSGNY